MAFCGTCGQQISDGVKFCPACGTQISESNTPQTESQPVSQSAAQSDEMQLGDKFAQLNNTTDNTSEFAPKDIEQNKVMAILAYFGILVLVPILAAKDSKFARFHASQGIMLCLVWVAWVIIDSILTAVLRAILWRGLELWEVYSICGTILNLVYLVITVLAIIGIINAANGRAKELPFIGKYKILK